MTLSSILALTLTLAAQAPAPPNKVEIVSVTGCLREQGAGNWMLVAATDPVPSIANQAPAAELPKVPPAGKNAPIYCTTCANSPRAYCPATTCRLWPLILLPWPSQPNCW